MDIKKIVDVQITRESVGVARQGFGVPLIFGTAAVGITDPITFYANIDEVLEDYEDDDPIYLMAAAIWAQDLNVEQIAVAGRGSGAIGTELTALIDTPLGNNWFCLLMPVVLEADILAAAEWIELHDKIFIANTADADVITSASDDVASLLQDEGYTKTLLLYSSNAATEYPAAALAGKMLPRDPGSATYAMKNLVGITADSIAGSEVTYLETKNCNYYTDVAGINITREGKAVGGEWFDVIIGIQYIIARMSEDILAAMAAVDKIPYTNDGIAAVANVVRGRLIDAVEKSILASYTVTVPKADDIDDADKIARELNAVSFTGVLAGAIQEVEIRGKVTV